jgi:hypothetical protein
MNFVYILKFEHILNKLTTKIITLFSGYSTVVYRNKSCTSISVSVDNSLFIYLCFTFHGSFGVNPILDIGIVNIDMNTLHNTYHDVYSIASIHHFTKIEQFKTSQSV